VNGAEGEFRLVLEDVPDPTVLEEVVQGAGDHHDLAVLEDDEVRGALVVLHFEKLPSPNPFD
jgi:hypothetical protein